MPDLLIELKPTVVEQGPDDFKDVQYEVNQAAKSVDDDQKNCHRVTFYIFRRFKVLERAENCPVGFRC
jgi:hypothetical protein